MEPLQKVLSELARYEHALVIFSAEDRDGRIELIIQAKEPQPGVHTYRAPVHPRDIEHSQFPWSFQRYLYDCLHDYMVELFIRTPQTREQPA